MLAATWRAWANSASWLSNTLIDQFELGRFGGVDASAGQAQLARDAFADNARQPLQRAHVGSHTHVDFTHGKVSVGAGKADVGSGDQINPRRCKRRGWRRSLVCGSAPGWRYRLAVAGSVGAAPRACGPRILGGWLCWMFSSMARSMPAQKFCPRRSAAPRAPRGCRRPIAAPRAARATRPGQRRWICPGGSASGVAMPSARWQLRQASVMGGRSCGQVNQQGGRPSSAHSWRFRSSRMAASSRPVDLKGRLAGRQTSPPPWRGRRRQSETPRWPGRVCRMRVAQSRISATKAGGFGLHV